MLNFLFRFRKPIVVAIHLLIIPICNYLAFWLRFDGAIPAESFELILQTMPLLILVRASIFLVYRLYQGLWRYTGIWDLGSIIASSLLSSAFFFIIIHLLLGIVSYPRAVFIIDSVLLIFALGGIRLLWRIRRELSRGRKKSIRKRVLIYGAGDAGEMIARDMKHSADYGYDPVGFVDDDHRKVGQRIHGIPVLGNRSKLAKIIPQHRIEEVIVCVPTGEPSVIREVVKCLEPFKIPIKTLPNLRDLLDEKITIGQIRNLSVEDLMARMPVNLDLTPVKKMLSGKRVLVTGSGGSIGSELCRQIAKLSPAELILYERYENGLFKITNELETEGYQSVIRPVLGDITDRNRVLRVFLKHRPEVVFHTAAHKHVPMMEQNPFEAVKNNVLGTRIVAAAASRAGVEKFILISTDKAVNPTSVMGATKRVAELIVQILSKKSRTSFVTVRFGNVLASNGSVVPLFLEQIARRGPVKVTHPDMRRYFMLIPEAVQLVLLSAAISSNAETFVLEMGEQISVLEMARNIIRLSGFIPEVDIPIVFTGLRPGEKLNEEIVAEDEIAETSGIAEILKIRPIHSMNDRLVKKYIRQLELAAIEEDWRVLIDCVRKIVPTFKPTKPFLSNEDRLPAPEKVLEQRAI
jgi:FlaA1/EpsC-like NDP-sugar epimerase